jgi:hypothetical protein
MLASLTYSVMATKNGLKSFQEMVFPAVCYQRMLTVGGKPQILVFML